MTVIVSDLVAKIRAEGVQETAAAVKAVGAEAAQTARALEIMAQSAVKSGQGGTVPDWLKIFSAGNVQPTAAAMTQAAQAAEKTAAATVAAVAPAQAVARATGDTVAPTLAAARAAEEVGKGWTASESSVVRFGAGILGVGLGISLVAGAARLVHAAIEGVVNAQLDWERSLVSVHALYGVIGPQVIATAQAQAMAPGLAGTAQDFTLAALNARYLSSRYGLAQGDITQLTSAAGRVAGTLGIDPAATQATFLQAITTGGTGLRNLTGTELDPLSVARRLGGGSADQIQALTPADLDRVRLQMGVQDAARLALSGEDGRGGVLSLQTGLQKSLTEAQTRLTTGLEGVSPDDAKLRALITSQPPRNVLEAQQQQEQLAIIEARSPQAQGTQAVQAAQAAFDANVKAIGDNQKALDDATAALEKLGVTLGTATFRLLGFTGSLEDKTSIARLDLATQTQSAIAARAAGPNPLMYQTPAEIQAQAMDRAAQDAAKAFVAPTAQQALQNSQAVREHLTSVQDANRLQGPGLEGQLTQQGQAAQQALADLDRRTAAETARLQAQQAGALAQRAQTEAQAQLSTISIQQDERRLNAAMQLAGYRTQALQLEGQLAPIMLQQAALLDKMVVASRDNLASRRELIAAEQQQLATTQVTSAYDYEQQRLELRAEQSRATVRQGGVPTEDINALRQQYRALELERAGSGADIAALDASRQVQVVGQQRTGEQLARDTTLTGYEAQGRALQDQMIPLAANLRTILANEASVQRTLALVDLQDTRAVVAAQHALNAASSLALKAAEAERAAADLAANQNLGATAADRWAAAMSKGYAALNDSAVAVSSIRDMMLNMPTLVVPTTAGAAANGGARVPGSEYAIPNTLIPFPKYDPARAYDQFPGAPPPRAPGSEFSIPTQFTPPTLAVNPTPYSLDSIRNSTLPMASAPGRDQQANVLQAHHITLEQAYTALEKALAQARVHPPTPLPPAQPPAQQQQPAGPNSPSVTVPVTINWSNPAAMIDQAKQAVGDALHQFISGTATAGPPAPTSVGGNGR